MKLWKGIFDKLDRGTMLKDLCAVSISEVKNFTYSCFKNVSFFVIFSIMEPKLTKSFGI